LLETPLTAQAEKGNTVSQSRFKVTNPQVRGSSHLALWRDILLGEEEAPAIRIEARLSGETRVYYQFKAMSTGVHICTYYPNRMLGNGQLLRAFMIQTNLVYFLRREANQSLVQVDEFLAVFEETDQALRADVERLLQFLRELQSSVSLSQDPTPIGV
jgi:hypothetical protein